jgi:hypothetical protein
MLGSLSKYRTMVQFDNYLKFPSASNLLACLHWLHGSTNSKADRGADFTKGVNASMLSKDDHDKIQQLVSTEIEGSLSTQEKTMLVAKQKKLFGILNWLKKYTVVTNVSTVFRKKLDGDTIAPAL